MPRQPKGCSIFRLHWQYENIDRNWTLRNGSTPDFSPNGAQSKTRTNKNEKSKLTSSLLHYNPSSLDTPPPITTIHESNDPFGAELIIPLLISPVAMVSCAPRIFPNILSDSAPTRLAQSVESRRPPLCR